MKKIYVTFLTALCIFLTNNVCLASQDMVQVQLNDNIGVHRFIERYNEFAKREMSGNTLLTAVEQYPNHYQTQAARFIGLSLIANEAGYITVIGVYFIHQEESGIAVKDLNEALMTTMAVIDEEGYPPVKMISDTVQTGLGHYTANNRVYQLERMEDVNQAAYALVAYAQK